MQVTPDTPEESTMNTCTVTVSADGAPCGKPAVTSFEGRDGHTYHECADHVVAVPPAPQPKRQFAAPAHPPTRSVRPYLLVRDDTIVGYAESADVHVSARARRLGARIVPNRNARY